MRLPRYFKEQLATESARILEDEATEEQTVTRLAKWLLATRMDFVGDIVHEFLRKQVKSWVATHRRIAPGADEEIGQTDLFPEIPRNIEVAPGRFVAQAFMTRRDWAAAVKQAETKASNATGHAEAIKQTADKVVPLLTTDDQTTAEVWGWTRLSDAMGGA